MTDRSYNRKNRIAQKHAALSLLRVLRESDDLLVLPVGRIYKSPISILPYMSSDYLDNNLDNSLSRFQGIIIYDQHTGGMCVFDVGAYGCELNHSAQQFSQQCAEDKNYVESASYRLGISILERAKTDLHDPVHGRYYPAFYSEILCAAESVTVTSSSVAREELQAMLRRRDCVKIQSGIVGRDLTIGWAPLLPENDSLRLSFGGSTCHHKLSISSAALKPQILAGAIKAKSKDSPEHLCCLLGAEVMQDPVTTPQGTTYDRAIIEKWVRVQHTDPQTRDPLEIGQLVANKNLKREIDTWYESLAIFSTRAVDNDFSLFKHNVEQKVHTGNVPPHLCCYLTGKLMTDPVLTPEGTSYERSVIEAHIGEHSSDPITKQRLRKEDLIPNRNLRAAIEFYNFKHKAQPLKPY